MATPEQVGQAVRSRRLALRLTVKEAALAAGVSDTTWTKVERGEPHNVHTAIGVARAMRWPSDALEVLAAGGTPDDLSHQPPGSTVEERLDALERQLGTVERQISSLSELVRRVRSTEAEAE